MPSNIASFALLTQRVARVCDLEVGDFVILHVGYALSRLDEEEAQPTLDMMAKAGLLTESAP